jgi:chemotaxis protein MotB
MAKNAAPAGAPAWIVTFADLMSLLVCFFVLLISFSVPDTKKLKIVAGSMRDAFGFQREVIVTGMVEMDGDPYFEFARDLVPLPIKDRIGPIPEDGDVMSAPTTRAAEVEALLELLDPYIVEPENEAKPEPPQPKPSEEQKFEQIEQDLRQAMQSVPGLARLAENLQIERVPEGLRIQIVDQAKTSMFPLGRAEMYEPTRVLLGQVARAIVALPNKVSIVGHTDSVAFRRTDGYDNWSLSLDRADATRRTLVAAGLDERRIATVIGKADTEPMFPDDPRDPRNRRISMTLLREPPAPVPAAAKAASATAMEATRGAADAARATPAPAPPAGAG